MTVIPIVIDALGTVTKGLVKELDNMGIRGRLDIIKTAELLRSDLVQRRVLKTWEDLQLLKFQREIIS